MTEVARARRRTVSPRTLTAVAGALYLVTFISSIPAFFLIGPVIDDPTYIVSEGADTQVAWGNILDLVNAVAAIGTAVAVFPVIRWANEALALGFVTTRLMEAAIIVVGVMALFTVITLRQPDATGAEAESLTMAGAALVGLRDWTFVFGPGLMPALNALMFATVLFRWRLVPRIIPLLGLIGAPILLSSTLGIMLGVNGGGTVWAAIGTAPIFIWELSIGIWMLVKGFNRTVVAELMERKP